MKIQEQIEKVYRVKGFDDTFKSNAEARKFARTEFAKGYMNEVKNKQEVIKNYRRELKKIEELEKEMAMYGERFAVSSSIAAYTMFAWIDWRLAVAMAVFEVSNVLDEKWMR